MKRILAISVLVFMATALNATPEGDVAQMLVKLENDWAKAALAQDTAALDKMLTADYIETDADGNLVTKPEMLAGLKSGASKYEIFKVEDMKVYVHGDAAVVIGRGILKGTENGRPIDESDRFTDTWVKHDGRWMAAATQVTRIPKK